MRLATFRVMTDVGPFDRFGIVHSAEGTDWMVDANFTCAALHAESGHFAPAERANHEIPGRLNDYCILHGTSIEPLQALVRWLGPRISAAAADRLRGPRGERLVYPLTTVQLRPPMPAVPVLRDFAAFEDHLENTFGKMGLKIPPVWYEQPTAFKANPTSMVGHDEEVVWPRYTDKLDYELELAAVIGRPARNIGYGDAMAHVLGFTLLNDFSARDTQRGEMAISTGPFKGKDFAWGLGPWIVTPDELGDPARLKMSVRVNGEVWAESTPGEMQWSFPEVIAYTAQDETLNIGDVIGSGTVNRGCGFEIDRWIRPGDTVELVADRIGVLRHRIALKSAEAPVNWRRPR
jgi:2-keto-4-pentenoate hydratase/2-oxohepta-3-ene-1,7-dioic acid hydratase in catechol pathway